MQQDKTSTNPRRGWDQLRPARCAGPNSVFLTCSCCMAWTCIGLCSSLLSLSNALRIVIHCCSSFSNVFGMKHVNTSSKNGTLVTVKCGELSKLLKNGLKLVHPLQRNAQLEKLNSWKSSETHLEPIPISGRCKVGCVTKVPFLLDAFTHACTVYEQECIMQMSLYRYALQLRVHDSEL